MSTKLITIDGPSGAGKGTICRIIADKTGYDLLDSGALYRLTALEAHNLVADLDSEPQLASIAQNLDIIFKVVDDKTYVYLNEQNVTDTIRQEAIGMLASKVAAYPSVRQALLERQRAFLTAKGLVADGRDMGTVVFPDAPLKIFLTASAEIRAERRVKQLALAAVTADYDTILLDIQKRDEQDRNRPVAPLLPAEDAYIIDCTHLEIIEVQQKIEALMIEKAIS